MKFSTISTGSKGNCYILHDEKKALIFECATKFNNVLKVLNFNVSIIKGCLISHEHGDHASNCAEFSKYRIKLFSNVETFQRFKITNGNVLNDLQTINIDEFKVTAFELVHDVKNFGYFVTAGNETYAYITDTSEIPYSIKGVNHLIVECNYDFDKVLDNFRQEKLNTFLFNRVRQSHLSIEYLTDYLSNQNTESLRTIILIHASLSNNDERIMITKIKAQFGIQTYFAGIDKNIELSF